MTVTQNSRSGVALTGAGDHLIQINFVLEPVNHNPFVVWIMGQRNRNLRVVHLPSCVVLIHDFQTHG